MKGYIFRWTDLRLKYSTLDYEKNLEGETWVGDRIWTPNIFIENEVGISDSFS